MPRPRALIGLLLLAFAAAAAESVVSGLVRSAWYWQARARSDKAEDAWKQVLDAAPENPEALAAVGGFNARAGRLDAAREMLARLEKISPGHPDVPVLRREIELGPRYGAQLAQARKLVHEGQVEQGAARYRELFGPAGPPGDLALEYYQTVGGTPGSWEQARDGLRRLVRRAPGEVRFKLALGKLLTWRDETRREGIQMLSSIAGDPAVGKDASAAWHQALIWLAPTERDLPLLRDWLKHHPNDAEVARHLSRARNAGTIHDAFAALDKGDLAQAQRLFDAAGSDPEAARGKALIAERRAAQAKKAGFAALQRGELEAAETSFRGAGNDADARLGLALVAQKRALAAQKQEDFATARDQLERARKLVPDRRDVWEAPLRSVNFWSHMRDAERARSDGRDADAEASLRAAIDAAPARDRWHADLALADLLMARRQRSEAEALYRDVLGSIPDQPDALHALAGMLVEQGRFDEALPVNARLAQVAPHSAFRAGWLHAEALRAAAGRSRAAGALSKAKEQLTQARDADPSDVWVLHDRANLFLQLGDLAAARTDVAELLRIAPALPEAQVTQARLLAAERQDAQALAVLRAIVPAPRDPSVRALEKRLDFRLRIPQILQQAAAGQRDQAARDLASLETQSGDEPELAAQVAVAWSKLGDRARALSLMRTAMARAPSATRGARLELASALLDAGDDAALGQILQGLERDPSLTAQEKHSLSELRIAHAVRLADRERQSGDLRAAEAALAAPLRDVPGDARLLAALARIREQAGDASAAHGLYLDVLRMQPDDADARRGAVESALAVGNVGEGRALLDAGMRQGPDDPRLDQLAAHVAEQQGDDGTAMRWLRRAAAIADESQLARPASAPQAGIARGAATAGAPRLAAAPVSDELRTSIARDIQRIEDRHRPGIGGQFEFRQRQGEAGLSGLTEFRESIQTDASIGFSSRASFRITEVELGAGSVSATAASRFGTGAPAAAGDQSAIGTELHAAWEGKNLAADIGTTGFGFPVLGVVGGVRVRGNLGPVFASIEGSSRSVTESVLSMAGATDPGTGVHWGGVLLQGGRLDLSLSGSAGGVYAYGEAGRLIGLRVQDNVRFAGGAGAALAVAAGDLGELRAGPAITALSFENNERFFTLGHGGYFSPQRFVHGGMVFGWRRSGAVRVDAAAEPGYDWYQEAHAPIFPLDPDGGFYPGQTQDGFSFNGRAFVGLALSSRVELGLTAGIQQAPEFQEVRAGVLLRAGAF
jgi:tetratricopeptide (TPR) repeat protein